MLTHETTFPRMLLLHRSGRHRQNGGRLEIGMVGAIRSERWAASDRNRWAAYVRIRKGTKSAIVATRKPSKLRGELVSKDVPGTFNYEEATAHFRAVIASKLRK